MAQERLSLRKIREVLRLKREVGLSNRAIARACRVSNSTVAGRTYTKFCAEGEICMVLFRGNSRPGLMKHHHRLEPDPGMPCGMSLVATRYNKEYGNQQHS